VGITVQFARRSHDTPQKVLAECGFRQTMSGPRRCAFLAFCLLISLSVLGGTARAAPVSPGQGATQDLFWIVMIPALGIGILVSALIAYAVLKFRVRPGHTVGPANPKTHDRELEALWTVIPAIILLVVGAAAFQTLITTDTIPPDPDVIVEINAHQWYWNFNITWVRGPEPNSTEPGKWLNSTGNFTYLNTTGAFTVQKGLVVRIILRSFDVIHSFYLVPFDLKVDVVPGHTNTYWFQALQLGDFEIRCAEFCGSPHWTMTATLHVVA